MCIPNSNSVNSAVSRSFIIRVSVHQCHLLVLVCHSAAQSQCPKKHVSCEVQWGSRHTHWACLVALD